MTIIRTTFVRNDGPYQRIYYRRHTDITKPKCWVEGFEYRFNSLVERVVVEILPFSKSQIKKINNLMNN